LPFEIIQHPGDAILEILPIVEIVYPEKPTDADIAQYDARAREIVDAQRRHPFCVLADQRSVRVMSPELVSMLLELNAYAAERGMRRTARVVSSAMGGLQTHRLAREKRFEVRAFESRDEALLWLREKLA
jgi:hypothetical protein